MAHPQIEQWREATRALRRIPDPIGVVWRGLTRAELAQQYDVVPLERVLGTAEWRGGVEILSRKKTPSRGLPRHHYTRREGLPQ